MYKNLESEETQDTERQENQQVSSNGDEPIEIRETTAIEKIKPNKKKGIGSLLKGEAIFDTLIQTGALEVAGVTALGHFDDYFFNDKTSKSEENAFYTISGVAAGLLLANIIKKVVLVGVANKIEKNRQEELLKNPADIKKTVQPKRKMNLALGTELVADTLVQYGVCVAAYSAALGGFDDYIFNSKTSESEQNNFHMVCGIIAGSLFLNIVKKEVLFGINNKIEQKQQKRDESLLEHVAEAHGEMLNEKEQAMNK